ncbi:hypothetical protein, partial [Gilliamella intestini]
RAQTVAWCNGLGYRIPWIRDLTNAKCGANWSFPCVNGIDGGKPSSGHRSSQRQIGAGFFAEWGHVEEKGALDLYVGSNFIHYNYWTADATGLRVKPVFTVSASSGEVIHANWFPNANVLCITP